ncbi:MAG: TraR/DksA C4-type zinc finger protein [Myxococcota bacterium]|nr:TraR/DksA C4-type zinc finger protein [Myxococcota bacterium]
MDELTTEQREELLNDLRKLQVELSGLVDGTSDTVRPVDLDEPIGRISRMDDIQQQKMARASRERHSLRLQLVAAALQRDPEDYGLCRICDETITFARLKVQPEASLCISCQSERERSR